MKTENPGKERPRSFRVIEGGRRREVRLGGLRVFVAPLSAEPFPVEAIVLEEDTYLVLSADPRIAPPEVSPVRMMTELIDFSPETPGSVVVVGDRPVRMLAVVNDVNQDPICREDWIHEALKTVFCHVETLAIRSLGLQMLGTLHGRVAPERFIRILVRVLGGLDACPLERLWLEAPVPVNAAVVRQLSAAWP